MSEITITGNAVDTPSLSYTPTGTAVATLRLARTERYRNNTGQWVNGDALFVRVTCWRQLAENVSESVGKGDSVVVQGKLRSRTFDDDRLVVRETGEVAQRQVFEITADDVSVSLRNAAVKITRSERSQGAQAEADAQDQAAEGAWQQAS